MTSSIIILALDSADPAFVRTLLDRGDMPNLASMLERGQWHDLAPPADEGAISIWPSLMTGRRPDEHLFYSDWMWDPFSLRQRRNQWNRLVPFWTILAERGVSSAVVDVPFQPFVRGQDMLCIEGWGCHEGPSGPTRAHPRELRREIRRRIGRHPFYGKRLDPRPPTEEPSPHTRLARLCSDGARMRGDLTRFLLETRSPRFSLVVFQETHIAGHQLFHTTDPAHPLFRGAAQSDLLSGLYREIDAQIGAIRAIQPGATIWVLSPAGMRSTTGIPGVLLPLLEHLGYCRLTASPETTVRLLNLRHALPASIRNWYYGLVPRHIRYWLADLPFAVSFDWKKTRVFPVYAPVHGWLRINLEGRERFGVVSPSAYESVRGEIRDLLEGLRNESQQPVVSKVHLPPVDDPVRHWAHPDIVVQWARGSMGLPLRLSDPAIEAWPISPYTTGTHDGPGFLISSQAEADRPSSTLGVERLVEEVEALLGTNGLSNEVRRRNPPTPHDPSMLFMKSNFGPIFG